MIAATYNMFSYNKLTISPAHSTPRMSKVGRSETIGAQSKPSISFFPSDALAQTGKEFQVTNSYMYVPTRERAESVLMTRAEEREKGEGGRKYLLEESAQEIKTALKRLYVRGRAMGLQEQEMVKYIMKNAFDSLTDSETDEEELVYAQKCQKSRPRRMKRPRLNRQEWDLIRLFPNNWKPTRRGDGLPADFILAWFNFRLQKLGLGLWKMQSRRWQYVKDLYGIGTTRGCWLQR